MEKLDNSSNEMNILAKYKYISRLTNLSTKLISTNINKNLSNALGKNDKKNKKGEEDKADLELKAKLKAEKKAANALLCARKTEKSKVVANEKFENNTPEGEKKGN